MSSSSADSKGGDPPAAAVVVVAVEAGDSGNSSSSNSAAAAPGATLILVPMEGEGSSITVARSLLLASEFITAMNAEERVPLPSIKVAVLKKIVDFLVKNAETPCPTIAKVRTSPSPCVFLTS